MLLENLTDNESENTVSLSTLNFLSILSVIVICMLLGFIKLANIIQVVKFLILILYLLKNLKKKVFEKEAHIQELSCLFQTEKVSKI